jgi:hypothetical protein
MSEVLSIDNEKNPNAFRENLGSVTKKDWINYCNLYRIKQESLKQDGKPFIPGHHLMGMLRNIIPKLHKKYPKDFPIKELTSFYGGPNCGTEENRLFIGEPISVRMEKLSNNKPGHYQFMVKFIRTKDESMVITGIFKFIGIPI